jgi:hypothetical protein
MRELGMKYLCVLCLALLGGCQSVFNPSLSVYHSDLHVAEEKLETSSELVLNARQNGAYVSDDSVSVTFSIEGLRIKVEPLSDGQLNALFPQDSAKGQFSTNPYTYGDWIDPLKGYSPKRFTVFRVTVINDIYAKVLLDPIKAYLLTDQGEKLYAFGIPASAPYESFEQYYRGLRGQSGNEFYRFDLRMGNVRSSAYLEDQLVFKGESYSGLIAFKALQEQVEVIEMILQDFIFKFDASGQPLESLDVAMSFKHKAELQPLEAD